MTSNTLQPGTRPHTTHYACGERLQEYGSNCVGCCCTGHACQTDAGSLNWVDKATTAPVETEEIRDGSGEVVDTVVVPKAEDFEGEPEPKKALRANVRNHILDQHAKIQDAISELGSMYIEAGEELGLNEDNEVASALSDLAVTSQRVIDKIEQQLNRQMAEEQRNEQ